MDVQSTDLRFGIACEAGRDLMLVQRILEKILPSTGRNFHISKQAQARTGIIKFVPGYARIFYGEEDPVDIGIFITDQDISRERDNRAKKISDLIEEINPLYLEKSVIAIPDPHLESWLLADHNAVKRVFHLSHNEPLPGSSLPPKKQLEYLRSLITDPHEQLSSTDTSIALAEEIDLRIARGYSIELDNFCKDIINKVSGLI